MAKNNIKQPSLITLDGIVFTTLIGGIIKTWGISKGKTKIKPLRLEMQHQTKPKCMA
jgi:Na+/glutamate symporter